MKAAWRSIRTVAIGVGALFLFSSLGMFAAPRASEAMAPPATPMPVAAPVSPPAQHLRDDLVNAGVTQEDIQADGKLLDRISVPANGVAKTTNLLLANNTTYWVRVVGSYVWGGCDEDNCPGGGPDYLRVGDAGFGTGNHWHNLDLFSPNGLLVNGYTYLPVTFNRSHVYDFRIVGNDEKLEFKIMDCDYCYPDNAYNLLVEIYDSQPPPALVLPVTPYMQRSLRIGNANWGEDDMEPSAYDFCLRGCYMTSWAMTFDYYGFDRRRHTDPGVANSWMSSNGGYNGNGAAYPNKVVEFGTALYKDTSLALLPLKMKARDDAQVNALLERGIPVLLNVSWVEPSDHWVLAFGATTTTDGNRTWYVYDPRFCKENVVENLFTLAGKYSNEYSQFAFVMPVTAIGPVVASDEVTPSLASTALLLNNADSMLVTDPQGRRAGVDPASGVEYNEIPEGRYYEESLVLNEEGTEFTPKTPIFYTSAPQDGEYRIEVAAGEATTYTLSGANYDAAGNPAQQSVTDNITPGSTAVLSAHLVSTTETFVSPLYSVDVDVIGEGIVHVSPATAQYTANDIVTVAAAPADGWAFSGWDGDLTGNTNPNTFTVHGNMHVTAVFRAYKLFVPMVSR